MGYEGPYHPLYKKLLHPYWRYLAHVCMNCLSGRKRGFDELNTTIASAMVALTMSLEYNFSKMMFEEFKSNLKGGKKEIFLMHPSFLQIILNRNHADLEPTIETLDIKGMGPMIFKFMKVNKHGKRVFQGLRPLEKFGRFAALPDEEIDKLAMQVQAEVAEEQLLPVQPRIEQQLEPEPQDPIEPELEDAEVISSSDDEGTPERPPVPINRFVREMESKRHRIENPPLTSSSNQDDTDTDYTQDQDLPSRPCQRKKGPIDSSTPAPVDPHVMQDIVFELEHQVATQNSKIVTLEPNQGYRVTLVYELKKQIYDIKGKQSEQFTTGTSNDKNGQGDGDDGGNDQGGNKDDTQGNDPFNLEFEGDLTDPKNNDFSRHLEANQVKGIQYERVESSSDSEMERLNQDIDDEVNISSSTVDMSEDVNASKPSKKERPPWRFPPGPPSETHVTVNIEDYYSKRGDISGVASWGYDSEKGMYVVKRKSGHLEYYKSAHDFSSLTKVDLHQLNDAYFENKGRNGPAEMFHTFLNEQCLTNFAKMKTTESKLKRSKVNTLRDFQYWTYDPITIEALIVTDQAKYQILDPFDLSKFSEQDIKVLARSHIRHEQLWEEQENIFTVAAADILSKKLYAGSGDHGEDINF
ncbi:hypothetical protein L1987_54406 [Smallanthus sonchifolius]|uniref:Uncharacterized protein n=1 Tax=Smallanthus sonchifolius TaxID=185202 RepID=A0ACB9E6N7_9ASTR|nr:hypothetical protein L1987_54406 [Smallanthus sonchifolius]